VPGDRRSRILATLNQVTTPELETKRLCQVCAEVTGMSGAGIMLMSGDVPGGSVCTTNEVSALLEHLQFELGEGPCVDAYRGDEPVLEPDLAAPETPRWHAFTDTALEAGVRAIFGFPLRVGAIRLGALNLYCDRPGALTDEQQADALVMAGIAAEAVMVMQANAPPGQLAAALEASGDYEHVVHQASGMVAAQLEGSVAQALIRLRAYAFGNSRPLGDVAQDVVARRLRFDERSGEKDPVT
jgi:GAF domain-containing protein